MRKSLFLFHIGTCAFLCPLPVIEFASVPFRFPVKIAFSAVQEREFVFHLKCKVRRKFAPLLLNVKTKGYAVRLALVAKNADGKETFLSLERDAIRTICLGEVGRFVVQFVIQYLFE